MLEFLRLALLCTADVVTTNTAVDLHIAGNMIWMLRAILMVSIIVWGYIVMFKVAAWKGKLKAK